MAVAITVTIDGVTAEAAAEIAAAVHAGVMAAAGEAEVEPVDAAPEDARGGWALVYRLADEAAGAAKTAGAMLDAVGKAGLGVVAGVGLVRTLRKLRARPAEAPAGTASSGSVLTITVGIAPEGRKAPSAADALKQLKEAADGLTALGKLLEGGG